MNEKFWYETLSQIDEKFTDEAAEHILAAETAAEQRAEPLKLSRRKRPMWGVAAGAAAVLAVGVFTAVILNRGAVIAEPSSVAGSAVDLSKPESSAQTDTPENSSQSEAAEGGFAEFVLDPANYSMDIEIFAEHFSRLWLETENTGGTYALSIHCDDFFNLYGRRIVGFAEDDSGWYMLCDFYGRPSSENELFYIPRSSVKSMYQYSSPKSAQIASPNAVYEALNTLDGSAPDDKPTDIGMAGLQFLCAQKGIDIELIYSLYAEHNSLHGTLSRTISLIKNDENRIDFTAVLYPADASESENAALFGFTLMRTDGEWAVIGSERIGGYEDLLLPTEYDYTYDFAALENAFFGAWREEGSDSAVVFSYAEDIFNEQSFYPLGVFSDERGTYLYGVGGGAGFMYFVPSEKPDMMYEYFDLGGESRELFKPDRVYYRTAAPFVWSKYPTKLSVLGLRYLELGGAGEVIKLNFPEEATDSSGVRWTKTPADGMLVEYAPYYLLDRSSGGKTDNILAAAKYYGDTQETSRYFVFEFDYATNEPIACFDWGDMIEDFGMETEFSREVLAKAIAECGADYPDNWRTRTIIDARHMKAENGACFAQRQLRAVQNQEKVYIEIFFNANNGEGFKLVYSTNDNVNLVMIDDDCTHAYLYQSDNAGGAYILRVSSSGELARTYLSQTQLKKTSWDDLPSLSYGAYESGE